MTTVGHAVRSVLLCASVCVHAPAAAQPSTDAAPDQGAQARIAQWRSQVSMDKAADRVATLYRDGKPDSLCGLFMGGDSKILAATYNPRPGASGDSSIAAYRGNAGIDCNPKGIGLITYADGSQWLGEVDAWRKLIPSRMLPVPSGLGEFRAADGSVTVGHAQARDNSWDWDFRQVVAGPTAPTQAVQATQAPSNSVPAPASANVAMQGPASAAQTAQRQASATDPYSPGMTFAPGAKLSGVNQIEQWRAQLAPDAFRPLHTVSYEFNLDPGKQTKACGGSWKAIRTPDDTPATPFRITFEKVNSRIASYEGYGYACTFPFPDPQNHFGQSSFATVRTEPVHGLIRYNDGSYWLGQVVATPANAVTRGGDTVTGALMFLPMPRGIGEWGLPDGTRLQGSAESKPGASTGYADGLQSGTTPHGLPPDMPRITRAILPDGAVATGDLHWTGSGFQASQATIVWDDGRVYEGRMEDSMPTDGTLRYPDGSSITGLLIPDRKGTNAYWRPGMVIRTVSGSDRLGPAGRYLAGYQAADASAWRFGAPLQPERADGVAPFDAETIAKPTRNTRNCHAPPVVPPGWIIWWPSCIPGDEGVTAVYRPDMQQNLVQRFSGGKPSTATLNIPSESRYVVSDAGFAPGASPSPLGEARMFTAGGLAFEGIFDGQLPGKGFCAIPADEGSGLEPCEFRSGQRVDELHHLRQQRIAMKRDQENLLRQQRQLEEDARRERQAWEEQEAERERQARYQDDEDDEPQVDVAQIWAQGIADAFQHAADVKVREAQQQVESSQRRRADMDAAMDRQRARTAQIQQADAVHQQRMAELQRQQQELERRQQQMRQQQAAASPSTSDGYSGSASGTGTSGRTYGSVALSPCTQLGGELMRANATADREARECVGDQYAYPTIAAFRDAERKCQADAAAKVRDLKEKYEDAGCHKGGGGGVRGDP